MYNKGLAYDRCLNDSSRTATTALTCNCCMRRLQSGDGFVPASTRTRDTGPREEEEEEQPQQHLGAVAGQGRSELLRQQRRRRQKMTKKAPPMSS